ncbi:MAG: F0F1 ATP synthase subunit epsilon [Parabacteroides distasonis]|nr:F0F1 ATP synthase subunit epsilon [Parabacteroides distasonis]MBQ4161575.1 F0F1 ATP synthase subunit epsilon [Parabacteroides sp.]
MKLSIVSPKGNLFTGEVNRISLPGVFGSFEVLPLHAPLIAALEEGSIYYEQGGKQMELSIHNGFVEIKNDEISVCIE